MSWFFGKKKVKDSFPDSGEEASSSTGHIDDYILVERQLSPSSSISGIEGHDLDEGNDASAKPFGLYPFLPDDKKPMSIPTIPSNNSYETEILCDGPSYLHCMKFQLNKKFEDNMEIDRIHADEILSFILRVKSENYDYDFSLENSVINEMATSTE